MTFGLSPERSEGASPVDIKMGLGKEGSIPGRGNPKLQRLWGEAVLGIVEECQGDQHVWRRPRGGVVEDGTKEMTGGYVTEGPHW